MRIIDRYICREVLSHALLGLAVSTLVFFIPQMVRLMDLIVRHSGGWGEVATLFLCTFPSVLTFTLPIGVLVGVLIGLGRMSADSELIAMNALGMGLRRLLLPIGLFALAAFSITLAMTIWLGPLSVHTLRTLENSLRASQATSQVEPRVFDERLPNAVLYIQDASAAATRWHGIFLAESDAGGLSRLTLAEDAIVISSPDQGKLELHLRDGTIHEVSQQDPGHYSLSVFGQRDFSFVAAGAVTRGDLQPINAERSMYMLLQERGANAREAQVEFHRRLAFPFACLVFALVGLPLAIRPRRGGRAAGFLLALVLIGGYYILFVVGAGMARNGSLPPWLGIWTANIAIAAGGFLLLSKVQRIQGESRLEQILSTVSEWSRWRPWRAGKPLAPNGSAQSPAVPQAVLSRRRTRAGFPQLLDFYLLRNFLFYFVLLLIGYVLLFETFTFFDLLNDIARRRTGPLEIVNYFRYLSYNLLYQLSPLACLVSVLVTLGIMTKNNELVAFKAAGISMYRIAAPLVAVGVLFAAGLYLFDDTYLPYANQRQDELRNLIKGRPPHTYYQPRRQWIFGNNNKIYNYQLFDPDRSLFGGLNVLELDAQTFALRRRVYAARAHWEPQQGTWILESGWLRDFDQGQLTRFIEFPVLELPELDEPPSYFHREVRQSSAMHWWELRQYIAELRQAGFNVARLSVQQHKKLAFPLMAPVIILLAVPCSIMVGTRGAVGGLALGVSLGASYWAISALLEAMGAAGQLPPFLAAWAPNAAFLFVGVYYFLKMPT